MKSTKRTNSYSLEEFIPIFSRYNWSDPFLAGLADLNQTDDNLAALAYTVNDSFIGCFAAGASTPCHTIMKPVKTDAGTFTVVE